MRLKKQKNLNDKQSIKLGVRYKFREGRELKKSGNILLLPHWKSLRGYFIVSLRWSLLFFSLSITQSFALSSFIYPRWG